MSFTVAEEEPSSCEVLLGQSYDKTPAPVRFCWGRVRSKVPDSVRFGCDRVMIKPQRLGGLVEAELGQNPSSCEVWLRQS